MTAPVRPNVATLIPYSPGKPAEELRRELGLEHVVKLASNENPLGPSPAAVEALRKHATEVHFYPDATAYLLKRRLAAHLDVTPDELVISNGTSEAIETIARTFRSDRSRAIVSAASFIAYRITCTASGVPVDVVPTRELRYDLDRILATVSQDTRFIFLANPNNPTGEYIPEETLRAFLGAVPEHVLVILDEAYFEYVDAPDYPDGMVLRESFPNLIVTRTFSKVYGLAGLRIGCAVMRPELADYADRVRLPFNTNILGQRAACAALDDVDFVQRSVRHNRENLARLVAGIRSLDLPVRDSVGNFALVELPRPGQDVFDALLPHGVIVRPMDAYGLPRHVRVSVGLAEEVDRFLEALRLVLSS